MVEQEGHAERRPPARRAFVAGWPIAHSRSPLIHRHWLKVHGLAGGYERHAVQPADASAFFGDIAGYGFIGGNVTTPHKEAALAACTRVDETARALGAVNTLWLEDGALVGANTDVHGFLANLDDRAPGWDAPDRRERGALVIGAGGAARAVVFGLLARGFQSISVANRTLTRAIALQSLGDAVEPLPLEALPLTRAAKAAALIVNTTTLGMEGKGEGSDALPLDWTAVATDTLAHDIVYTPLVTPFLAAAEEQGLRTVDGLGMLLHQAVPGFERWFGLRPQVDATLRDLVVADIERVEDDGGASDDNEDAAADGRLA